MEEAPRARLPQSLHTLLDRLEALDAGIAERVEDPVALAEEHLAQERSALLRRICEETGQLADTGLRERVLKDLVEANDRLYARSVKALSEAGEQSATGALQRRAILAYGAQDDTA